MFPRPTYLENQYQGQNTQRNSAMYAHAPQSNSSDAATLLKAINQRPNAPPGLNQMPPGMYQQQQQPQQQPQQPQHHQPQHHQPQQQQTQPHHQAQHQQFPVLGSQESTRALDDPKVFHWICQLTYGPNKEQALLELGKQREQYDDLALVLWSSFGVMTALLQEIISVFPLLSPPVLNTATSNRVCNALVLLQCVASHPDTKDLFLQAHIPLFLFPFLNTTSKQRTFEYLRLTSLGVIGALVKNDSSDVIAFLLRTDIIPLCLRIMESSTELSKTVAIFILQKILMDDAGLAYICQTSERFNAVAQVLNSMVEQLQQQQTNRLVKHVVRCYLRLSDNPEARRMLKQCLPEALKDGTFSYVLRDDVQSLRFLAQLLSNLG